MRWVILNIVYFGCVWEAIGFCGYVPTWSNMIERMPTDIGPLVLGAFLGAVNWWAWNHFRFGR